MPASAGGLGWIERLPSIGPVPVLVLVATLAGAVLRFAWLDAQPLWNDERGQIAAASLPFLEMLEAVRGHAAAAPLDYVATRVLLGLGVTDTAVRLWPALIGTLSIPVLWLAAGRWAPDRVAQAAAVLLAVAPFHVYYSGEARFYALSALWAIAALLTFRSRWFVVAVAGALYTHYFCVIVPLGLVVIHRRGIRSVLLGVALWLPWALYALPAQVGHTQDIGSLSNVPTPALVAELLVPDFNVSGLPWIVPAAVLVLAGTLFALGVRSQLGLVAIVAAAIVLTGLATWRNDYFWSPRQILFALPLVLVVVAAGADRLRARLATAALAALLVLWVPFIDGVTGADAWQPRTQTLER